ncbi:MAG: hypothetical protein RIA69_17555 [Cyclobacteriaceae bacterium]
MAKGDFVKAFIEDVKGSIDGVHAVTVVELESGMDLGNFSDGTLDPEIASAYNAEVVKSKLKAIKALGLNEKIDDILITLESQYHLISCTSNGTHMIYLAADKAKANLAMLRNIVRKGREEIEKNL